MTIFDELNDEYMNMCGEQEDCSKCKYNGNFPCQLAFGYDKGRTDAIEKAKKYIRLKTHYHYEDVKRDFLYAHEMYGWLDEQLKEQQ